MSNPTTAVTRHYGVKLERSTPLRLQAHPQARTVEAWAAWAQRERRPLAADLFAGGGGLSLGLERAGYRVALSADSDPVARETHAHNFGGLTLGTDLGVPGNVDEIISLLGRVKLGLLAGGPPCQPFSRAGRSKIRSLVAAGSRPEQDERRELWRSFLRIALEVRPDAVLLENVPDMALGDETSVVRYLAASLEEAGYDTHVRLVDAWRHGVPQHRQRLILVAVPEGAPFRWPGASRPVTLWDAIGDLPELRDTTGTRQLPYAWGQPLTDFQTRARAGMGNPESRGLVWDHQTRPVREDDRRAFQLMTSTTRYSDLPSDLRRYRDDSFDDKYKRLGRNELSRSITAHIARDGYWYIHPTEPRTLTIREAARVQTFPDDYRFAGSRSDAFRQIGNAVPPALAAAVGTSVRKAVRAAPAEDRAQESVPRRGGRRETAALHEALTAWARVDRTRTPWLYPPLHEVESGHTWQVLITTVLESARADRVTVQRLLGEVPDPAAMTDKTLEAASAYCSVPTVRALRRLRGAALAATQVAADETQSPAPPGGRPWWAAVQPGPAERTRLRLLAEGEDLVVTGTASLRVAARVTGEPVDRVNRNTAGRLAVARLVGSGAEAPLRMAALNVLGTSICGPGEPACGACPLMEFCPGPGVGTPTLSS